jgi:hypothetical protein
MQSRSVRIDLSDLLEDSSSCAYSAPEDVFVDALRVDGQPIGDGRDGEQ